MATLSRERRERLAATLRDQRRLELRDRAEHLENKRSSRSLSRERLFREGDRCPCLADRADDPEEILQVPGDAVDLRDKDAVPGAEVGQQTTSSGPLAEGDLRAGDGLVDVLDDLPGACVPVRARCFEIEPDVFVSSEIRR